MRAKRIIITSLVGSIGLSVLGLSLSFAWYNSSENLYLDSLVINVSSSRNLLISTENSYDSLVSKLKYDGTEESNLPGRTPYKPVSTMFKNEWIDEKADTPVFYEYQSNNVTDYTSAVPKHYAAEGTWGFYCQHLYLFCDNDAKVTIDSKRLTMNPIAKSNEDRARKLLSNKNVRDKYALEHPDWDDHDIIDDMVEKMNRLVKSMRIAILDPDESTYKFSIIDPYKDGTTLLGGREDLFLTGYYDYYKNVHDGDYYEIIYGEITNRDSAIYGAKSEKDSELVGDYTSFNSCTKKSVHPLDLQASMANGLEIATEDSYSIDEIESNIQLKVIGGELKEFVLAVYMEGWDLDCVNSHMGGSFLTDIEFKVAEVNEED